MGSYHICKMGSIYTTWGMRNVVNVILMNKHLGQADCNCNCLQLKDQRHNKQYGSRAKIKKFWDEILNVRFLSLKLAHHAIYLAFSLR